MAVNARVTEEDELFLRLDGPDEPWSVHAEVHLGGRLDPVALRSAVAAAMEHHPMARASLSEDRSTWRIADSGEPPEIATSEWRDEPELNSIREAALSRSPSLDGPPPFALTLAGSPSGDVLILNLNHGVGDGIGAFRLLASILRAYAGVDDPASAIDPLRMRDLREFAARRTIGDRVRRIRERSENREVAGGRPVRLAPDASGAGGPAGLHLFGLSPKSLEKARARRRGAATLNDLLLASLVLTIRSWNDERGVPHGPILITVPVNIRPREWSGELIANLAATLAVSIPPDAQTDLEVAQLAVAERTQRLKRQDFAEMLAAGGVVPIWLGRLLGPLLPTSSEEAGESAVLSNVGRTDLPSELGPGLPVESAWFSPPVRMPSGLALGVAMTESRLFATLRYGPELLDPDSAEAFTSRFLGVLLGS